MPEIKNWKSVELGDITTILPEMRPVTSDGNLKEIYLTTSTGQPIRILAGWDNLKIQKPLPKKKHRLHGLLCPGINIDQLFDDRNAAEESLRELTKGMVTDPDLEIEEIETYE